MFLYELLFGLEVSFFQSDKSRQNHRSENGAERKTKYKDVERILVKDVSERRKFIVDVINSFQRSLLFRHTHNRINCF